VIYLSTAATRGGGGHRGIGADEMTLAPVSAASQTWLVAKRAVLSCSSLSYFKLLITPPFGDCEPFRQRTLPLTGAEG
jgi:hypothetical protein